KTRTALITLKAGVTVEDLPRQVRMAGGMTLVVAPGRAPLCIRCHRTGHICRECRVPRCNQCRRFGHETDRCVRTYAAVAEPVREEETSKFLMDKLYAREAEATREEVPGTAPEVTTDVKEGASGEVHQRLPEIVNLTFGAPGGDDSEGTEAVEFEKLPICTDTEENADIPMANAGAQAPKRSRETEHVAEGAPK
ncbi:uncharacterized protein LOC115308497, partial [Ixodes scapularis]|uniref:uncharacterized protein LOC115308497 n=1 Tax=Ixodes scapularis TaxID=6945 RepID=UPI001C383181